MSPFDQTGPVAWIAVAISPEGEDGSFAKRLSAFASSSDILSLFIEL
jgi:hypothetical protein